MVKKLTLSAFFTGFALVLSYVESMFPVPVPFPGVRLGLANIVILLAIRLIGIKYAFLITLSRCILTFLMGGNFTSFVLSFCGSILSVSAMSLCFYFFKQHFSLTGISVTGALFHNIGQICAIIVITGETMMVAYLPVLVISGVITGFFTGFCARFAEKMLKKL